MRSSVLRRARVALLLGLILPAPAMGQSLVGGTVLNGNVPAYNVNGTAPLTIDQATLGLRVTCVSGCSGGSGGGGTANPYPGSDYATAARQDTGNAGIGAPSDTGYAGSGNASLIGLGKGQYVILSSLLSAYGTTADTAAAATGANGTDIALLKALRDKLNGSIAITAAALPLPAGAATASNQASEIAALGAPGDAANASTIIGQLKQLNVGATPAGGNIIGRVGFDQTTPGTTNKVSLGTDTVITASQQAVFYSDLSGAATSANGTIYGPIHDLGSPAGYSSINATAFSNQPATVFLQACSDSACSATTWVLSSTATGTTAGSVMLGYATTSARPTTRWWRTGIANGSTAGATNVSSSATAN